MITVLTDTETNVEITPTGHSLTLADGTELFYRAWIPRELTRKAVIIFHRGHEHSGRLEDVVRDLRLEDIAIFAWDARGHGQSSGERGYAPSFGCLAKDADAFIRHLSETHGIRLEDMVVVGHSVGAVMVAAWVHDYAPPVRAMVLLSPALRVKLFVPFANIGLRLMRWLVRGRPLHVSSYVKGRLLTHDPEEARRYDTDPLISRRIAVNVLLGLHDTAERLIADARAIRTPTLMLAGGADWVVSLAAERRFFERLGTEEKRMRVFNGMYHDILHEKDRQLVLEEISSFVRKAFAGEKPSPGYTQTNFTHNEYERLCRPLPILSPNRLWYATQRVFMKTYGRLSAGIRLGWKMGFDSGSSLDYIYENRARGSLLIGRLIDRIYLNTPAWVGIRQRKANIEKLLRNAIVRVNDTGAKVQLLDVATGQGRYVLETLAALADRNITAVLRDYTEANVEAGRAKAVCLGLQGIRFERADAFSPESYTVLNPRPNIVIVSGLFELFSDNALVRQCLKGLTEVIEEGGYLIYTGQPWHPQIEMIARVLVNHRGEPWRMRRRPQGELDELVREAGFRKIVTEVGGRGIFTVSLAQKGSYNQNSF